MSLYTSIVRILSNNIFKQNLYILVLLRGTGSCVFQYKGSLWKRANISIIDKVTSLLNSISMHNDGSQFSLPVILNYVSGPLTHAKKIFPTNKNKQKNFIKCMLFFFSCLTCIIFLYHIKKIKRLTYVVH